MRGFDEHNDTENRINELVTERLGVAEMLSAIGQLVNVLDRNQWLWQWDDGYGGYVRQVLDAQIQSIGLPLRRQERTPNPKRDAILERDLHMCVNCFSDEELQIDHIMPRSRGGGDEVSNLQVLCARCNNSKRAMTMEEWEDSGRARECRTAE